MASGTRVANTYIDVAADLTNYRRGLATAKTEAMSLGQQIKAALSGQSFGGRSGIAGLIEDLKHGGNLFASLKRNLPGISRDLAGLSVKPLVAGLGQIDALGRRVFGNLKNLAGSVFKGFALGVGIGAFLSLEQAISRLIHAIPDLINKGRDYVNEVDQIVDVTGAASERASLLISTLKFLGQDVSTVYIRMGQLSKSVHEQEQELNSLGVTTRDVNGDFLNQVELLFNIQSAFSKLPDGVKKARLEVLLFGGRGGLGQLVDFLALTDEQITVLGEHFEEQGLIINDEQRRMGEAALRAGKDIDNAFTGLATQLFNIVGPQIIAFLSSIATAITENAEHIATVVSEIVNTLIGLFQGLTGITLDFDSTAAQLTRMTAGASESSFALSEMEGELATLKEGMENAGGGAAAFNDEIEAGVKALEDQQEAIVRQIGSINRLADISADAYRKMNDVREDSIDLETEALDLADRRIAREQTAADLLRDQAQAYIDLREAQAQYNKDRAEGEDQGTLDRDIVAIADAAQKVRDVQEAISNNTRKIATEDRKVQIENLKAYVKSVEDIVLNSENKKAALNTLTKRKAVLEEHIATATTAGNAQEVLDLKVKLAAVEAGIVEEGKQIKAGAQISELEARKQSLEAQKEALRAERQTEGQINRASTQEAIRLKEAEIAAEKKRIAAALKAKQEEGAAALELAGDYKRQFGKGGVVPNAFEASRLAGMAAAEGIKKAFGDLANFLFGTASSPGEGKQGPTGPRAGGFLGMLGGLAGAFSSIAGGFADIVSGVAQFKPRDVGLAIAAFGVYARLPHLVVAGLLLAGASVAAEQSEKDVFGPQGPLAGSVGLPGGATQPKGGFSPEVTAKSNLAYLAGLKPDMVSPLDPEKKETVGEASARLQEEVATGKYTNKGYADGGVAGLHGVETARLGERGPELVVEADLTNKLASFLERPMVPAISVPTPQFTGGDTTFEIHVHVDNGEALTRMFGGSRFIDYIDDKLHRKSRK